MVRYNRYGDLIPDEPKPKKEEKKKIE